MLKLFVTIPLLFISYFSFSQQEDTSDLPFHISNIKKLDSLELANKKEGTFITGVPYFSKDPINGFGYGAEGSIIFDGNKSNPFFNYTPYLTKIDIALFNTTKQQREFIISLDNPYIFKSKWRLRAELAFETTPNLLYFGLTDHTLNPLGTISGTDKLPISSYNGSSYSGYEKSLTGKYSDYNTYIKTESILNVSGEYSLLDGKMRVLVGGEFAKLNLKGVNDTLSRLNTDEANSGIKGVGRSTITFLQAGIVYDTRDFEPDPNRGMFAEITNELSNQALGSNFNFNKVFTQVKWYKKLLPNTFNKVVFANRFGIGYTFGSAPFFEYQDEWSSEGSIEGLGGAHTIRGYKQSRFLDRGMYFYNAELRAQFYKFSALRQDIALSAVPFFDAGSVYNQFSDNFNINRVRNSKGLGLRVAWNLSTILRFDYAVSKEDKQFFFIFEHAF